MGESKLLTDNNFNILKDVFSGNEITYISTPINTGKRFIDWYSSTGKNIVDDEKFNTEKFKNVIEPNVINAKESIEKIREKTNKLIIDPTKLESDTLGWSQEEFYKFWDKIIKSFINHIIFIDGWEFSIGCCFEALSAIESNIDIYSQNEKKLTIKDVSEKLKNSVKVYKENELNEWKTLNDILEKIIGYIKDNDSEEIKYDKNMKDEKLNDLIKNKNVNIAQFISFSPNSELVPRFININNFKDNKDPSAEEALKELMASAPSKTVNIRSFSPKVMKGNKLVIGKGIEDLDEILNIIKDNSSEGKYSIINENIDINDGGVSGVILGDIVEFSPEDTPKCVEQEGVCSLPKDIAFKILNKVYGFAPESNFEPNYRIEFSIHPNRQGVKKEHTIIWEYEYYNSIDYEKKISWPNNFSRFLGDKVFGLLIADSLGIRVPKTTVISRKVAPFSLGTKTGLNEKWIRTSPIIKEPGKYYTGKGWIDPFKLMNEEEAKGSNDINIASIMSQEGVEPLYSGASLIKENPDRDVIEGVSGRGDDFMVGEQNNENLPEKIKVKVRELNNEVRSHYERLGTVSIEWVYDGEHMWLVQLNQIKEGNDTLDDSIIVSGEPSYYEEFFVTDGLESLRNKIEEIKDKNVGIKIIGNIGLTSHFGDVLRLANVPSMLKRLD